VLACATKLLYGEELTDPRQSKSNRQLASELSKKKCKKTDGCDYKKKQCSAASSCSGLSKKKQDDRRLQVQEKEGDVPRQVVRPRA
jgi:hypothetical protein